MNHLRREFNRRAKEVRSYIRMLRHVEEQQTSPIAPAPPTKLTLDSSLVQTMKASVYLLLYNLVESTINQCLQAVGDAIRDEGATYRKLNAKWRKAWVKHLGQTSASIGPEKRLDAALSLCDHLVNDLVIEFTPTANTGNLDDRRIEDVASSYGIQLSIRKTVRTAVKREVFNDEGALGLVRRKRNSLAHGLESFAECGRGSSTPDLRRFAIITILYLEDVIDSFDSFIRARLFAT